jgi:hypothetical protein
MKDEPLKTGSLTLFTAITNANHRALKEVVIALAKYAGMNQIDGVDVEKWYEQRRALELQNALIRFEDCDPGSAAALQREIDDAKPPAS